MRTRRTPAARCSSSTRCRRSPAGRRRSSARPASGRRQHHHAGPLPGPALRRGSGHRAAEVRRGRRPAARVEPQAPGLQHRADHGAGGRHPRSGPRGPRVPGPSGRRSARIWRTPPRWATARSTTGGNVTARSTSSCAAAACWPPSRPRADAPPETLPGMAVFSDAFRPTRKLLVGGDGIDVGSFLATPVTDCVRDRRRRGRRTGARAGIRSPGSGNRARRRRSIQAAPEPARAPVPGPAAKNRSLLHSSKRGRRGADRAGTAGT